MSFSVVCLIKDAQLVFVVASSSSLSGLRRVAILSLFMCLPNNNNLHLDKNIDFFLGQSTTEKLPLLSKGLQK